MPRGTTFLPKLCFLCGVLVVVASGDPFSTDVTLVNLSTRGQIGTGDRVLIGGFVVEGTTNVLIRGVGPSLKGFSVEQALADPGLQLFNSLSIPVAENTDWRLAIAGPGIPDYPLDEAPVQALVEVMAKVGAFPLLPEGDTALYLHLEPGLYTYQLSSRSGSPGVGLNEVYIVPDSVDPFTPGLRVLQGAAFDYQPARGGLAPNGVVDRDQGTHLSLSFDQLLDWPEKDGPSVPAETLTLSWVAGGTGDIRDGLAGVQDSRGWTSAPRYEKEGPNSAVIRNLVTQDSEGNAFIEEATLTFTSLGAGQFTYRWGPIAPNGKDLESESGTGTGEFTWGGTHSLPEAANDTPFFRVFPESYSDGRPSAFWALRTHDDRPALRHGDGPSGSDVNGAREAIVTAIDDQYVMHYDGCADDGWLACRAVSTDLVHWQKQGPILEAGSPGSADAGCVCSPWTIYDGDTWHMFYLAASSKTPSPESVPESPYVTMKARSPSLLGAWSKQPEVATFEHSPGPVFSFDSAYQMIFTSAEWSPSAGFYQRTLALASTDDLDQPLTVTKPFLLPPTEQIENASIYQEPANGLWFVFTNHVGVDADGFEATDAVWVYWSDDPTHLDPKQKARVVDASTSSWAKGLIGMPSVVPVGDRLALFYDGTEEPTRSHLGRDIGVVFIDLPLQPPIRAIDQTAALPASGPDR